jgi:cytoskeletal protein CcmA (bactofilin family)
MAPVQQPEAAGEINTLLGRGSEFEGKLTFEGTVRIDGKLSGEVFTDDVLVIGEGAEVNAEIDVGTIIIEGQINGNVRAKRSVEIHAPGRVRGNIVTPSLFIDKGVVFEGNCQMEAALGGHATGPRPAGPTGPQAPGPTGPHPPAPGVPHPAIKLPGGAL